MRKKKKKKKEEEEDERERDREQEKRQRFKNKFNQIISSFHSFLLVNVVQHRQRWLTRQQ